MAIPILGRRKERRQAELTAVITDAIEKAGQSPALAGAPGAVGVGGATYPVPNPDSPFMQTGGNFGAQPLPRPNTDFGSLFGPGYPLFPDALDPLGPNGRAQPRRDQYPVTYNIQLIDRDTPWSVLRRLATEVDVVNRCIELVQDSVAGMDWSWGFSDQIINQIMLENDETNSAKATAIAREKYGNELTRVQQFFEYPDKRMGYTFSQWLTLMVWSHLVYDGIAVYPQYTLGGELHSLSQLDTSTIKILRDNQGFIPQPPAPAYQQILYGFPRGEYLAEDYDGDLGSGFQSDQLAYYLRRPRPHTMYGYSTVEECINAATLYMNRQEWMHAEWSNGVTPKLIVNVEGTETWTPEQLAYYEQVWNDRLRGQTQRRQSAFFMRPGMSVTQLDEMAEKYSGTYDEYLVLQIGAKFGVPQSQLGIQMRSSIGGAGQTKGQSDQSDKFATDAMVNFLIDCINDMARRFMGVGSEISMTVTGGGDGDDDLQRAQADASDVGAGIRTRNEIRAERGIPLMSEPEADQLAITTGTGVSFLAGQLEQQQEQAQASIAGAQMAQQGLNPDGVTPLGQKQPPQQNEEDDDHSGDGQQQGNSGSGSNASNGAGKPSGSTSTSGGKSNPKAATTATSNSKPAAKPTAKDDSRQPDTNDTAKELAAFTKFAKSHAGRTWRDFTFHTVDSGIANVLNELGREGDLGIVHDVIEQLAKRDDTPSKAEDTERLMTYWAEGPGAAKLHWGIPGDFDACVVELGKYVHDPDELKGLCANLHHRATGAWPGHAPAEIADKDAKKATTVVAAGIVLKADDTGRVILVQRDIDNKSRPEVAGLWEWPGGTVDDGEDTLQGAMREFEEEVGVPLPKGKVVGSWTTSNGYQGFCYVIKHEDSLELTHARSSLDGSGDKEIENVAWWNINDLQNNPAVRPEVQSSDWALIGHAQKSIEPLPYSEEYMNLVGRDGFPDAKVEVVTLDYFGQPKLNKGLSNGDRIVIEKARRPSATAVEALADKYQSQIVSFYAPKIEQALRNGVKHVDEAVHSAITTHTMQNDVVVSNGGRSATS